MTLSRQKLNAALDGAAHLARHEVTALQGHWRALHERVQVARRARGPGELLRNQVDLLPESRSRLLRDHDQRRALWREWVKTIAA